MPEEFLTSSQMINHQFQSKVGDTIYNRQLDMITKPSTHSCRKRYSTYRQFLLCIFKTTPKWRQLLRCILNNEDAVKLYGPESRFVKSQIYCMLAPYSPYKVYTADSWTVQSINMLAECHPSLKTSFNSPYLDLRASTAHKKMPQPSSRITPSRAAQQEANFRFCQNNILNMLQTILTKSLSC